MLLINSVIIEHETLYLKMCSPAQELAGSTASVAWAFRSSGLRRSGSLQVPEGFFSGGAGHQEEFS